MSWRAALLQRQNVAVELFEDATEVFDARRVI